MLSGQFKELVFLGMVEAMATRNEKLMRGVGLQGMHYVPSLKEWAHVMNLFSPRVYQACRQVMQLPLHRMLQ